MYHISVIHKFDGILSCGNTKNLCVVIEYSDYIIMNENYATIDKPWSQDWN